MKKIFLFGAVLTYFSSFAQQTIIVNGGQFGNQQENVNVVLYDGFNNTYSTIDTIQTQSVQEIIIDGFWAYVAAQDSIVKYNLSSMTRIAAAGFNAPSTKALAFWNGELLVGNWYGQGSHNLYIYDAANLTLLDSIAAFDKGAKSILIKNGIAFITQNASNSNFQDTLGTIIRFDIANRTITDTISVAGYTGDFGELIENASGTGFYAFNSAWNTVTSVDYSTLAATNSTFPLNLNVSAKSHWSIDDDTLFARFGDGIGAIDLNNLAIIDSNIVDTVVTAFTYDTVHHTFFVTQTNFFSYNLGKEYDRQGNKTADFTVGYSPEVIRSFYGGTLNVTESMKELPAMELYPNPVSDFAIIKSDSRARLQIYNTAGKLLLESSKQEGEFRLDLSQLAKGSYILVHESMNEQSSKIFIKH